MYRSSQRKYLSFCSHFGFQPLPLSESVVCKFCAFLADHQLSFRTIKVYISGLRHLQVAAGLPEPFKMHPWPRLEYVLKGIKWSQAEGPSSAAQKDRLPITPDILRKIKALWSQQQLSADRRMLWAAFTMGFFGFLRAGEFTVPSDSGFDSDQHLCPQDVSVDCHSNPRLLRVTLKQSKTDPFRHGIHIFLGRSETDLCPVSAMLSYLVWRGNEQGPLFKFADGRPLTRERLVSQLRTVLTEIGIKADQFAGHSFRIGAATTAAAQGIEDSVIKILGRWESSAYQRYLKMPRESLAAVSALLGQPARHTSLCPTPSNFQHHATSN